MKKTALGLAALAFVVLALPVVAADTGHDENQMHGFAQMHGGAGSSGIMMGFTAVFWISLWVLILLAIVYLVQEIDWLTDG